MRLKNKEKFTSEDIKEKLIDHYGPTCERELVKTPVENDHGTVGSIYYSITGSPPKGHAVYIPGLKRLSLYDAHGKRFAIYDGVSDIE